MLSRRGAEAQRKKEDKMKDADKGKKATAPVYLNDRDAAAFIAMRPQTLRNWRQDNKGPPYIKVGRAVRYSVVDLIAYMEAHKVKPYGG
jgi:hypothetical protein